MIRITSVHAYEILDSRGFPTVETAVFFEGGYATASVPAGASTGKFEAFELRDKEVNRFNGMGVKKAVANVNNVLGPAIIGFDLCDQFKIDQKLIELDGTANKEKMGANAILSLSLAVSKAASYAQKIPPFIWFNKLLKDLDCEKEIGLPTPIFNVINGGKHGVGNLDFQEFQIIPASDKPYPVGLRIATEIYHQIRQILKYRNTFYGIGDEGGFAPNLYTNLDALEIIVESIKQAGYLPQKDIFLGLDIAPSYFYQGNSYRIKDNQERYSADRFIDYIQQLHQNYHLLCLEDPLQENDWNAWVKITSLLGGEVYIIGDDLLVTNPVRLQKAIDMKACNAILVKPNQIGSLLETLKVIKLAYEHNFKVVVSHRSGETCDFLISDLAVGVGADFVKFGAPARGERVAKYNRLLQIASEAFGLNL